MPRLLSIVLLLLAAGVVAAQPDSACRTYRVAFWNVENLFDTQDDSLTADQEFTPFGSRHWSRRRYDQKCVDLYKTLIALSLAVPPADSSTAYALPSGQQSQMPLIVGLAEVENSQVLRDLCLATPLRSWGYRFVHYDSPDPRGIDNALLYDPSRFVPIESRPLCMSLPASRFFTRDILRVTGVACGVDTLVVFVCHFPSKLGGASAAHRREELAARLRAAMDSARALHPAATILAMGDFNATPDEAPVRSAFGLPSPQWCNLMAQLPAGEGSHKFQGHWSCLDQIIISVSPAAPIPHACLFAPPFLLTPDPRHKGLQPRRTFAGSRYLGGISDHLPVFVDLVR